MLLSRRVPWEGEPGCGGLEKGEGGRWETNKGAVTDSWGAVIIKAGPLE